MSFRVNEIGYSCPQWHMAPELRSERDRERLGPEQANTDQPLVIGKNSSQASVALL